MVNMMRWRHESHCHWHSKVVNTAVSPRRSVGAGGRSLTGRCLTSTLSILNGKWRCLFWSEAQMKRRGWAAMEGDGREQGMGIKSLLILNYSRDKNPIPKRPTDDSVSPSVWVGTVLRLESRMTKTWAPPPSSSAVQAHLKNNTFPLIYLLVRRYLWAVFVAGKNLLFLFRCSFVSGGGSVTFMAVDKHCKGTCASY